MTNQESQVLSSILGKLIKDKNLVALKAQQEVAERRAQNAREAEKCIVCRGTENLDSYDVYDGMVAIHAGCVDEARNRGIAGSLCHIKVDLDLSQPQR